MACRNQDKLSGDSRDNANVQVGVEEEYKLYGDKLDNMLDLCNALHTDVRNHKEDLTITLQSLEECPRFLQISEDRVLSLLVKLDSNKASDPDGISNRFLKD